jgi:hypothetical protein
MGDAICRTRTRSGDRQIVSALRACVEGLTWTCRTRVPAYYPALVLSCARQGDTAMRVLGSSEPCAGSHRNAGRDGTAIRVRMTGYQDCVSSLADGPM